MDAKQAVKKYPELEGLYIPERGEIIHWGKGTAIAAQSPLEKNGGMLLVFTLNTESNRTIRVSNSLSMGPYEALDITTQVEIAEALDRDFNKRLSKLFDTHHWMKDFWEIYRKSKSIRV